MQRVQSSEIISAIMKFFATALLLILGLQQVVSQNDHLDFPGMTRLGEYRKNVYWIHESLGL